MLNFEDGSAVSGQKFYYLQNAGALLELALVNWTMNKVWYPTNR
jgi:seryl-tRNA synthetase